MQWVETVSKCRILLWFFFLFLFKLCKSTWYSSSWLRAITLNIIILPLQDHCHRPFQNAFNKLLTGSCCIRWNNKPLHGSFTYSWSELQKNFFFLRYFSIGICTKRICICFGAFSCGSGTSPSPAHLRQLTAWHPLFAVDLVGFFLWKYTFCKESGAWRMKHN
jgi:hypothetical protein